MGFNMTSAFSSKITVKHILTHCVAEQRLRAQMQMQLQEQTESALATL